LAGAAGRLTRVAKRIVPLAVEGSADEEKDRPSPRVCEGEKDKSVMSLPFFGWKAVQEANLYWEAVTGNERVSYMGCVTASAASVLDCSKMASASFATGSAMGRP